LFKIYEEFRLCLIILLLGPCFQLFTQAVLIFSHLQMVTGSPVGDILGVACACVVRCGKGHWCSWRRCCVCVVVVVAGRLCRSRIQ
jgi:hypothetical protein